MPKYFPLPVKAVYLRIKTQDMNREILRLAVPNIISNITVPLMGIVSSAVAGHLDNSAATIGALAIGVSIFNFIYWNCSFVRMGTSGLTAQAFGAGNFHECTNMLVRGILVAAILGLLVICFQNPLGRLALWAMNGNEIVHDYFYARIWAVPAGIMLFGFNGWYTGMQNAVIPMCIAVTVNIVHVSTSLWLVFGHGMGITGIAYGSVVAQNTGVLLAVLLLILRYRKILTRFTWREVVDWEPVRKFFLINRDIIVRTLCIVAVYTFFTAASARMEDPILLTVNTLLLQIFTLFSYMNDGFAYAAEALTGRFIGARDEQSLRRCLGRCLGWGTLISVLFVGIYLIWWRDLLGIFIKAGTPDAAQVVSTAGNHHGRYHGGCDRNQSDAQFDAALDRRLFRYLLLALSRHRKQRPLAGLHALYVPARHAATPDDPAPAAHLSKSCGINFPTYLRPAKDGPSSPPIQITGVLRPADPFLFNYCIHRTAINFSTVTKRLYGTFLFAPLPPFRYREQTCL